MVIVLCKFYNKQTEVIIHLCFSFVMPEKKVGKRSFNYLFVQTFCYLHIRVLYRRGGVSPPVIPALSIYKARFILF